MQVALTQHQEGRFHLDGRDQERSLLEGSSRSRRDPGRPTPQHLLLSFNKGADFNTKDKFINA